MDIQTLHQDRARLRDEARAALALGTDAGLAEAESKKGEIDGISKRIAMWEQLQADEASEAHGRPLPGSSMLPAADTLAADALGAVGLSLPGRFVETPAYRQTDAYLDAYQRTVAALATPAASEHGFESFGHYLQAVAAAGPAGVDPRLTAIQTATGLGQSSGAGGTDFIVEKAPATAIMTKAFQTGQVMSRVNRIPIGAGFNGTKLNALKEDSRADGSRYGGVQAYYVGDAEAPTATKPSFRAVDLGLDKTAVIVYVTNEALEDATMLQNLIMSIVPQEIAFTVEDKIINGLGGGIPLGVMQSSGLVTVSKEGSQAAATVEAANVLKMFARLHGTGADAMWLYDPSTLPQLATMTIGDQPVFLQGGSLANGQPAQSLLGISAFKSEYTAQLGTKGDLILFDGSQYVLIDKGSVRAQSSVHVKFLEDETAFKFTYRNNGLPLWNKAQTPKNGGDTVSAYVTLETRS